MYSVVTVICKVFTFFHDFWPISPDEKIYEEFHNLIYVTTKNSLTKFFSD